MPRYVLALDQGTTSSRAMLIDRAGNVGGVAQREFTQHFPREGWVEHDPVEIWQSQLETAQRVLREAAVRAENIAAIGVANQRETTILWERSSGAPIGRAIVWQDRRTAELCRELAARDDAEIVARKTGLRIDPYFSATKIAWILDSVEGLRDRACRGEIAFGTVDAWLLWNLTGGVVHATDYTNAARTLLFDIETLTWDEELLGFFDVPRALLPEVKPCTAAFGAAEPNLFGGAIPIGGVAGDQQAALIGQVGFAPGSAKNTYGTGSFAVLNTGEQRICSSSGLLTTIAYALQPGAATYALEASIFATGAAVQWLRDGLGIIQTAREVEVLAASVPDNGGVYFVPAFVGLGAPYWDPFARGAIVGLTRGSTRAHLARATLEAMAYQSADAIAVMTRDAGLTLRELRVDGGAAADDLAMQIQADVLGADVIRPRIIETTALGAAYLAGLQVGFWNDSEEVERLWRADRRFTARIDAATRVAMLAGWHAAVARVRSH